MNKIYYVLILSIILFFTYGIFNSGSKKDKIDSCQEKTITFDKIVNKKLLNESVSLLQSNNYKIKSRIEKSTLMKSIILNYITVEKANKLLVNTINKYSLKESVNDKKLLIDYYIYENDKEDKGKKGKKSKLYAGYLVFEFKLDNNLVYKIQSDYMQIDTSDIAERMDCIIKSFIKLKKEK